MSRRAPVVALVVAAMLQPVAGRAQKQGYGVSVGLLTVSSPASRDFFSSTDFQVRIRRQDEAIEAKVSVLGDRISRLDKEADRLLESMAPLRRKKAQSEVEPGPPLTAAERELLSALSALPLAEARDSHIRELRRLNRKDEASRLQPGPRLNAAEEAELQSLTSRRDHALRGLRNTRAEYNSARALIYGRTRTVDSDSRTLDFNSGPVLTVYEGDVLRIAVVDVDLFEDDLFGTYSLNVTREMLEKGTIELGHTGSIRSLALNFMPTAN